MLIRQVAIKTVMNTKIYMILKTISNSFGIAKRISKDHKGVHIGFKISLSFFTKKKKKNTK